jgi:hypothetical protein
MLTDVHGQAFLKFGRTWKEADSPTALNPELDYFPVWRHCARERGIPVLDLFGT